MRTVSGSVKKGRIELEGAATSWEPRRVARMSHVTKPYAQYDSEKRHTHYLYT